MPTVALDDATIAYDVDGEGPWLVLLHEIGGTRETWARVAAAMASRFKVLRYDMRGCGESSKISGAFRMETHVLDLHVLLGKLGAGGPVHLAGVALGSAIAVRFATQFPRQVRSLMLACPAPNVDADRVKYLEIRAAQVEREGMTATVENSLANSYPPDIREPAVFDAYRARFLANDPQSYAAINRAFPAFDVMPDFPRIGCPALVLAGTQDKLRPPGYVRDVAARIPGAQSQEIDSGHIMPVQAPQAMTAAMSAFYEKIAM